LIISVVESHLAVWPLIGGTLSTGCLLIALWLLMSGFRRQETAHHEEEISSLETRVHQLAESLKETVQERDHLRYLTISLPGFTRRFTHLKRNENIGNILVEALRRSLQCKRALVYLQTKAGLTIAGSLGLQVPEKTPCCIKEGEGRAGWAAKVLVPMSQADFNRLPPFELAKILDTEPLAESFDAYVPLVFDGQALGVICISGPDLLDPHVKSMLSALANIASLAIEKQRSRIRENVDASLS